MASVDVSSIVSIVFRWIGSIMHFTCSSREQMTSLRFIRFSHLGRHSLRGSVGGSAGVSKDSCVSSSTFSSVTSRTENRLLFSNGGARLTCCGIHYINQGLHFLMRFRRCHIFGGKLILQFPFYLVYVHVSDVETEVAFLRPMSGQVQPGQVGLSLEGGSWQESGSRVVSERHGKPHLPHGSDPSGL